MNWLIIILIVLLVVGCIFTYHTAETHELHKMRAQFLDVKQRIELVKAEHEKHQKDEFTDGELEGELREIDEVIKIVDNELDKLENNLF